jgi:dephospho-CoA kinase
LLIGVVGLNGSGKDAVAKILVEKHGFKHKDFGQLIRSELKKIGRNHLDRSEMFSLANERRKSFGNDYWAKILLENYSPNERLVLTSIRNPAEAELIQSYGGLIVEVFASQKIRFERTVARVSSSLDKHGEINFKEFKEKEKAELKSKDPSKQQLLKCLEFASKKIDNNGNLDELETKIALFIEEIV